MKTTYEKEITLNGKFLCGDVQDYIYQEQPIMANEDN